MINEQISHRLRHGELVYVLRIPEFDPLQSVLEFFEIEIHQSMSMLDYQRLQIMVKRTIEQKIRTRNFQARNERNGMGAVSKNRREKKQWRKRSSRMLSMESTRTVLKTTQL